MPVYCRTETIAQKPAPHARSVDAFCDRNGISRATFYNLAKRGQAPDVLKIGARTTITEEAEADWKRRHTAQLIAT